MIDDTSYRPPNLDVNIVLNEKLGGAQTQIRDVVLCAPRDSGDTDVLIGIEASLAVTASGTVTFTESVPVSIDIDATIEVAAGGTITAARYVTGITIAATASINPSASGFIDYDANVFRGAIADISSRHESAKLASIDKHLVFERNANLSTNIKDSFENSKTITNTKQGKFESNVKLSTNTQSRSEQSNLIGLDSNHKIEDSSFAASNATSKTESAKLVGRDDWLSFEAMAYRQTQRALIGEYGELVGHTRDASSEYGFLIGHDKKLLIEFAKLPSWFDGYIPPRLWQTIILKKQQDSAKNPLDIVLYDRKKLGVKTRLRINPEFITVGAIGFITAEITDIKPQTGVIFVTNSVSLVRSDDGREVKMLGFSVGIDSNSYTWSFSATVPLSELSKVNTAIEQRIGVDFTCNGNLWRFILDDCSDSVSFGESSLTIKGKSRAMLLAHPYAQQRGFKFDVGMSARQIAEDELNRNGIPSGFTLDWQLAGVNGWNIPANTYSYTGKTPINSLQWIAEAAGGFINADMSQDIIHVLAHYPIPSWEWAAQTPSINLTQSLITSRSRGRVNKPAYNGVTIYGENDNGIGALIKRAGTSGGYQPPMVTSDLMTDTAAAISRGKMILSDTGDIGNIGISMPLVADIGVLKPSTLIGVNDGEQWVGMVRGTTITGRLSSNRALEIDQSIDVERHFDKEIV